MIHDIRDAFNDLLEENDWMDMETRLVAEDKANRWISDRNRNTKKQALGCTNVQKVFKIQIPPLQPIILVPKVSPSEKL